MSCKCVNPDGTLSPTCDGSCCKDRMKSGNAVQERQEKTIEDRFEYLLGIFLQKLDDRIHVLTELCMAKYKEGYRDGFNDGQSGY